MYIGASSGSNFFAIRDRKQANAVRLYRDTSGNVRGMHLLMLVYKIYCFFQHKILQKLTIQTLLYILY